MHETLSKQYIGNIDSVKKEGRYYIVRGWVVPVLESEACSVGCEGFVSVVPEQREDIYNYYKQSHLNYLRSGFLLKLEPTKETTDLLINNELVFRIQVDIVDYIIKCNIHTTPEIIVVDDFYTNPDAVRKYALEQEYVNSTKVLHEGMRSTKAHIPTWIKSEFEKYVQRPIKELVNPSGVFRYTTSHECVMYHFDDQDYAAVIFLNPNSPLDAGISTYKSKITSLTHKATEGDAHRANMSVNDLNVRSFNNNIYDRTNMEIVDSIANIYNRLVIYNSKALHASMSFYGSDKNNACLYHAFYFNL